MRFKTVLLFVLLLSIALPAVPVSAKEPSDVSATAAILYHPASGSVLFEKNADHRRPIASTTKIVTALTVLQTEKDLDRTVAIDAAACGIEGSSLYLKPNETLTVRELLYGLLLQSANDAATALAISCAGSVEAFADRMNQTAAQCGLQNSHFTNPHGLDAAEHYATARDLAVITAEALENDVFREIVSTVRHSIPSPEGVRTLVNHNKLLRLYPDCIGVKTGFTKKSGRCLVSAAQRDGERLVCVTLNAPNDWNDHSALLDYGFSRLQKQTLLEEHSFTFDCPVVCGDKQSVTVFNAEEITISLPIDSESPTREIRLPRFLGAPVTKGEIVGYVVYKLNGRTVGESPLVAADPVGEVKIKKGLFHR